MVLRWQQVHSDPQRGAHHLARCLTLPIIEVIQRHAAVGAAAGLQLRPPGHARQAGDRDRIANTPSGNGTSWMIGAGSPGAAPSRGRRYGFGLARCGRDFTADRAVEVIAVRGAWSDGSGPVTPHSIPGTADFSGSNAISPGSRTAAGVVARAAGTVSGRGQRACQGRLGAGLTREQQRRGVIGGVWLTEQGALAVAASQGVQVCAVGGGVHAPGDGP